MKATRATIVGAVAVLGAIAAGVFHELTKEKVVNVRFDVDWDNSNVDDNSSISCNEELKS